MKLIRLFLLALTFYAASGFISQSFSQVIYFCEDVDEDGDPINESTRFTIPSDGGYLYALIQLPYEANCDNFILDIYRNDDYENTITVSTEDDWTVFWKQINFYKPGEYVFYVYDCDEEYITQGTVNIVSR